jgi:hypothetical protein
MARSIPLPPKVYSNVSEAARHHADGVDDVASPRCFLIRRLIQQYIQKHREAFTEKQEGQYVFQGGDGSKHPDPTPLDDGSIVFSVVDPEEIPDGGTVVSMGLVLREDQSVAGALGGDGGTGSWFSKSDPKGDDVENGEEDTEDSDDDGDDEKLSFSFKQGPSGADDD